MTDAEKLQKIKDLCKRAPHMREGVEDPYRVTPLEPFVKVSEVLAIIKGKNPYES